MEELPTNPRGLKLQTDFITAAHEAQLVDMFRHELAWPASRKPGGRVSLHYGYTFDYKTFGVDPAVPYRPFPAWLRPLIPTGVAASGRDPDQVCLQHYPPGAGIPPHVDTHSAFDELCALSLGSAVVMRFRLIRVGNGDGDGGGEGDAVEVGRETVDVDLPPRSMMQMSGDARLHWEHGIKKRKKDVLADGTVRARADRWSITYRWLREGGRCECGNRRLCDTAQRRMGVEREFRWKQDQQQQQGEEGQEEREEQGTKKESEPEATVDKEVRTPGTQGLADSAEVDIHHHENRNILSSPP